MSEFRFVGSTRFDAMRARRRDLGEAAERIGGQLGEAHARLDLLRSGEGKFSARFDREGRIKHLERETIPHLEKLRDQVAAALLQLDPEG